MGVAARETPPQRPHSRNVPTRRPMDSVRDSVFFVSDGHFGLGNDEAGKNRCFAEMAAEMRGRATDLYILGDLFDFWIEYRHAIRPDYFLVLHELRGLVQAGVKVHYLTGNHDFALGNFLEKTVGVAVGKTMHASLQGRNVYMRHGDNINKSGGLKFAERLMHSRFLQTLYKALHPNIGVKLGRLCSAASKKRSRERGISEEDLQKYRRAAQTYLKSKKCDLVILAHTHHSELVRFDEGEYCNTGSWMDNYDYAVMRGGEIRLCRWLVGKD